MNAQLGLLVVCQSLYLVNNITFIAINGLVGLALAPQAWMATLPIMGYVLGGALSTGLVARTQRRWGRRGSFRIGLAVAFVSALGAAAAVWVHRFVGVCLATVVAGYYSANGTLYRFAAAELVAPAWREKAVSLLMAGGLVGAVVGPNLAALTRDWLCRNPSSVPTWRWPAWRCCRCSPCPSSAFRRRRPCVPASRAAGRCASCCGSRPSSSPASAARSPSA